MYIDISYNKYKGSFRNEKFSLSSKSKLNNLI